MWSGGGSVVSRNKPGLAGSRALRHPLNRSDKIYKKNILTVYYFWSFGHFPLSYIHGYNFRKPKIAKSSFAVNPVSKLHYLQFHLLCHDLNEVNFIGCISLVAVNLRSQCQMWPKSCPKRPCSTAGRLALFRHTCMYFERRSGLM